jgi:hypothetical protein
MKWVKHNKPINRTSSLVKVAMGLLRTVSLTGVSMALFFSQFFIFTNVAIFSSKFRFCTEKTKRIQVCLECFLTI